MEQLRPKMDKTDLSQECCSYMKIKQFLANRLSQQQDEINCLKRKVKYYIAKDAENQDIITKMSNKINYMKKKKGNESLCSEDAISQNLEDIEKESPSPKEASKIDEQNEEDLREEIDKLTTDKYILFNELNELVMALKRCKLDQLNELLYKDLNFTQGEMPITCGLNVNILSTDSQLSHIVKSNHQRAAKALTQEDIDYYDKLVKECEIEFSELIDKKLLFNTKTTKSYLD